MSFPTDFPQTALTTLIDSFKGTPNTGRLVLSVYDLVGYGLFQVFGDVKYLMGATPEVMSIVSKIMALFDSPEFKQLLANLPQYTQLLGDFAQLKASGLPTWLVVIRLGVKYGPEAVTLVLKLYNMLKG
jgi:hypothetical protein